METFADGESLAELEGEVLGASCAGAERRLDVVLIFCLLDPDREIKDEMSRSTEVGDVFCPVAFTGSLGGGGGLQLRHVG
jgi:hypothetical protein